MDEATLLKILKEEETDAASYYTSELAIAQSDAMDRFHARPYGDEESGRSKVVTHDVEDTINWLMPMLMRTFASSDDLIVVDDDGLPDNDPSLKEAADYLRHAWFKDNDGTGILHDFAFDALLQKVGIVRAYWEDPQPRPPRLLEGLTADQLQKYMTDPEYEILAMQEDGPGAEPLDESKVDEAQGRNPGGEGYGRDGYGLQGAGTPAAPEAEDEGLEAEPDQGEDAMAPMAPALPVVAPPQAAQAPLPGLLAQPGGIGPGQPGMAPMMAAGPAMPLKTFSIMVQKTPRVGRVCIECFPPENFRISRRAKTIEAADYHGGVFDKYMIDVLREYPERAYDLDPTGDWGAKDLETDQVADVRIQSRFPDEPDSGRRQASREEGRRKVKLNVEYVNVDYDGDGIVELRRIVRVGSTILENYRVPESEFVAWSPIRVAHRLIGRSIADTILDIQKIRTVITRKAMDGLTAALQPRTLINDKALGQDDTLLDRLLDHDVGDVIPVSGNPDEVVKVLTLPDVTPAAFQAIEYWDRRSEEASGVNRHAMGIQPQAITDTKGGIENLQAAANARVELVARWMAQGLEKIFSKVLRIIVTHQDAPRQIKVNGKALVCDPRRWSDEMTVSVHVGLAAESREKKLAYLGGIAQKQEQILKEAGPSNPIVGLQEYRNTLARMAEAMGERNASVFFKEVPPNWQPPPPGPDPKVAEAQAKHQLATQELQGKQQLAAAQHQLEGQKAAAQLQGSQRIAELEAQLKAQGSARDAEIAKEIALVKAQSEQQIAAIKLDGEQKLAAARLDLEERLAQARLAQERELALMKMEQEKELAKHAASLSAATKSESGDGGNFRPGGRLDA